MRKSICRLLALALLLCIAMPPASLLAEGMPPLALPLEPYSDVRYLFGETQGTFEAGDFDPKDIPTFTFNADTVLAGSEAEAAAILEAGKNPGLGVRQLHARGITGEGVNVAIIDQNLLPGHPEYEGKLAAYHDTGSDVPEGMGSMHAPAVMSLLVGETVGTAPGASVYFAVAPSWTQDSQYFADALYWIIERNQALPDGEKIRVVSISAAPSGPGTPFTKNQSAYDNAVAAAQAEGILVLDCRVDAPTGRIAAGYYDTAAPEDVTRFTVGWPGMEGQQFGMPETAIAVPTSFRTMAEHYFTNSAMSWQYYGRGGLSWGIPYAAGVLAMGWQVVPELDGNALLDILHETSYVDAQGNHIINPTAFIEALEARP